MCRCLPYAVDARLVISGFAGTDAVKTAAPGYQPHVHRNAIVSITDRAHHDALADARITMLRH